MQLYYNATDAVKYFSALYGKSHYDQYLRYNRVLSAFARIFGGSGAYLCSVSGRVELIGNHTDHNGGRVLGCAIDLDVVAAFRPNGGNVINVEGRGRNKISVDLSAPAKICGSAGLVRGVAEYLASCGYVVGGFDAYTDSTVTGGAGISSSAAFETAIAAIINSCFNNGNIPYDVIARAGQYAENKYFNKPCGLLDQSVVGLGGAVALDFADGIACTRLDVAHCPVQLVLVDTGVSHSDLSPLYAAIPSEMFAVAQYFGRKRLIEVDEQAFARSYDDVARVVGKRAALRAKHFFEENRRVDQAQAALLSGDAPALIAAVNASGDSSLYQLQNCSVSPSDTAIADIIAAARAICPCGARVHGGGFAGTVLCVVPNEHSAYFTERAAQLFGRERVYPLRLRTAGATVL